MKLPSDFAKKIAESLGLVMKECEEYFDVSEDKEGFFVAKLQPKKFLEKDQFRTMCALVLELGGDSYLEGMKAWKVPGPYAKKSTEKPSDQGMDSERPYKEPSNAIPIEPSNLIQKTSEIMRMKVSEIIYDEKIYPRDKVNLKTVNQYREAINGLPPLLIDKKNRLVDGYHRLLAYRQEHYEDIDCELFNSEDDGECLLESIRRNSAHGMQLTSMEKKRHALALYKMQITEDSILKVLSVSKATLYEWTKDARKEEKEQRDQKILSLYLACRTEQEIGDEVGLSLREIQRIIEATRQNSEIGKMSLSPPSSLQVTNLWQFDACDPSFGAEKYPGRMPGQIVQNLLWYYTEPFDIVLDPMAGSGTTSDVCKSMYRRYLAYDLSPIEQKGIQKWNVLDGLPQWRVQGKPKLILLDPPYADMKKGEYTLESSDLSNMSHELFQETIFKLLNNCADKVDLNGTIALVISSSKKENVVTDWGLIFGSQAVKDLRLVERIIVPYENAASMTGIWIDNARKNKQMLRAYRDLLIFQR